MFIEEIEKRLYLRNEEGLFVLCLVSKQMGDI